MSCMQVRHQRQQACAAAGRGAVREEGAGTAPDAAVAISSRMSGSCRVSEQRWRLESACSACRAQVLTALEATIQHSSNGEGRGVAPSLSADGLRTAIGEHYAFGMTDFQVHSSSIPAAHSNVASP